VVRDDELTFVERLLENRHEALQVGQPARDVVFVALESKMRLRDEFKRECAECAIEVSLLPELPAHDIGAQLRVPRQQLGVCVLIGQVLHDGTGLPQREITIDQHRCHGVQVDA